MNAFLSLFLILLFAKCGNTVGNRNRSAVQTPAIENVSQSDTITKISKPFKVNNIECYWTHCIVDIYDARMILKTKNTNEILVDTDFFLSYWLTQNHNDDDYFDQVDKECLVDLNFDGFTDFKCENNGSNGAMSNSTLVFLFNPQSKSFDYSEDFSLGVIIKVDTLNQKLISVSEYRHGYDSLVYYFDKSKSGRIQYSENFRRYSSWGEETIWSYNEYEKIVDGNVVESKRDSTKME